MTQPALAHGIPLFTRNPDDFDGLDSLIDVVPVDGLLLARSGDLAETEDLRGFDAVAGDRSATHRAQPPQPGTGAPCPRRGGHRPPLFERSLAILADLAVEGDSPVTDR